MFFSPYLLQMAKTKKMLRVKVVCLEVLHHPSNFLPSLKKHLYIRPQKIIWRATFGLQAACIEAKQFFSSFLVTLKIKLRKLCYTELVKVKKLFVLQNTVINFKNKKNLLFLRHRHHYLQYLPRRLHSLL